jgi:Mg2+/Co2+ transporter CorC
LGGFIVDFAKGIPQKGEVVFIDNFVFKIEAATNNKIELVRMTIKQ